MLDWLTGWTLARGTPPPVADGDGWYVDVDWPEQKRRHVFHGPSPQIARLAHAIDEPWVFLKAPVSDAAMAALLPPGWLLTPPRFMMICDDLAPVGADVPAGYHLRQRDMPVPGMTILDDASAPVASGQVVRAGSFAIFDSISVAAAHRRRGLGRVLVSWLTGMARAMGAEKGLLVATGEGRALYENLGWRFLAPYASAVRDIQRSNQEAGPFGPR